MSIRHVVVAIPARNEAVLLGACLASITEAVQVLTARSPVRVAVVVALDGCTDTSGEIARRWGTSTVELAAAGVGAARDAAIRAGIAACATDVRGSDGCGNDACAPDACAPDAGGPGAVCGTDAAEVWIANTDADTVVPPTWLTTQLRWADSGHDVVIGTVEPVGVTDLALLAEWHARHELVEHHTYVHGANLGVRASTYVAVGGFPPLRLHEDVELVTRARASGVRVIATDTTRVQTSGRCLGRAHGGFADYLGDLADGCPRPQAV